jgi:hypothetical protein
MNHTDKRRISAWLKELREKQFVGWIYDLDKPENKSTPAVYYLGINGVKFLRASGEYSEEDLRKRYKDGDRQQDFVDRCLLLADCVIHLEGRNKSNEDISYTYAIEADYTDPDSDFYYVSESELIHPDLVFTKEAETDEGYVNQTYFVQLFDLTTPRYMVKKKLKEYVEYFDDDEWGKQKGDEELPIVLVACPTTAELIFAKRYVRKQLEEYLLDDREDIVIRFTTTTQIKQRGMTSLIWEDV